MAVSVVGLHIYPCKGTRVIDLDESRAFEYGLEYDRRFMIIDQASQSFLSQRQLPQMSQLSFEPLADGLWKLSIFGQDMLFEPSRLKRVMRANIWDDHCDVVGGCEQINEFLSNALGRRLQLVSYSGERLVNPKYTDNKSVSYGFADGFPYLITNQASLEELNQRLQAKSLESVDMSRFRANIVLDLESAYLEDKLDRVRIGECEFKIAKPCVRCQVTTIDQQSGRMSPQRQPLQTLAEYRNLSEANGIVFGQNAYLLSGVGRKISTSDKLEIFLA